MNDGLPLGSLGIGLLMAGTGWALGHVLFEAEDWWIPAILGLALGGVGAGLGLALE